MKKRHSFLIHLNHNADGVVVKVYSRYIFLLALIIITAIGGNLLYFNRDYLVQLRFRVENMEQRNRVMNVVVDSISEKNERVNSLLSKYSEKEQKLDSISGDFDDGTAYNQSIELISKNFSLSFIKYYSDSLSTFIQSVAQEFENGSLISKFPLIAPISPNSSYFISQKYGNIVDPLTGIENKLHESIDFSAEVGVDVIATAQGKVVIVKNDKFLGRVVKIKHSRNITTVYAHLGEILVKKGATVSKGTAIGKMGLSKWSSGPHVHYELLLDGEAVDPLLYLEPKF